MVEHVVFVDTAPVRDGYAMNAELEDPEFPLAAAWDSEMAEGSMRDLTDEQLQMFQDRAVPQPGAPSVARCACRIRLGWRCPAQWSARPSRARITAHTPSRVRGSSRACWTTPV